MDDLSECQCSGPGWCKVFKKEMGVIPPNWKWCQDTSQVDREKYLRLSKRRGVLSLSASEHRVSTIDFYDDIPEPKSTLAICVIPANESAKKLLRITRQRIKGYARECGADYIELTGDQHPDWPMANKYRVGQVTSIYEKTLYLDCDILVSDKTPNIFEITPDDKISGFDEYCIWSQKDYSWIEREQDIIIRKTLTDKQAEKFLDNGRTIYPKVMINGGVLVIPKSCAKYYQQPTDTYPKQWCFDQNYLTLLVYGEDVFNPLDLKWNCLFTCEDGFWYNSSEAYFIHVNSLRDQETREAVLSQISLGDFCPIEPQRYENSYQHTEPIWQPSDLNNLKSNTFKSNKIGLIQGEIAPGGALTWMKLFAQCFSDDITGIVPIVDFPQFHNLETGMTTGYSEEEMKEVYVKSDIIIYWAYYLNESLPMFIRDNPLNKKIIYVSHAGFRHNRLHDILIDILKPDVSVFVDKTVAKHYNGICIPPPVFFDKELKRKPVPKNILWHHRIEKYKGVQVLADIINCLPDFNFHIAGSWLEQYAHQEIIDLVNRRILSDSIQNVFYYGHVEDVSQLFRKCSLSLSTSYDESFGLSVAESLAHGIPTVSHPVGVGMFSDSVVRYKSHATEWAKAIRLCEETTEEAKNRDYIRENFSIENFKVEWNKIL